jgi:Tol biopolymer transport system component/DNA-binding winged helix-turn-helix (wHTH) protein
MNDTAAARQSPEIALAREEPFELAGTSVRPAALEVEYAGAVVSIERRVMQVLVALARAEGQPVSRDDLINLCWSGRVVTEGAVNRCVAQLRKTLGPNTGIRLETIPKVGYRLRTAARVEPDSVAANVRHAPDAAPSERGVHEIAANARLASESGPSDCGVAGHDAAPSAAGDVAANGTPWPAGSAASHAEPITQHVGSSAAHASRRVSRGALLSIAALGVALLAAYVAWRVILPHPVTWTAVGYRPLTSTQDHESFPALSPNGQQIVYALRPDAFGPRALFLRNVDQGTPVRITSNVDDNYGAAWSLKGDRIAFVRSFDRDPCMIIVVPVPIGAERVVTKCQTASQTRVSWLDDHTLTLADKPKAADISRIRAVNVETGATRDLTSPNISTLGDTDPQASPDGRYIVFRRTLTLGADDLYMLDVRTGRERPLTHDGWKAGGFVWSSDSRHVFFSSNRGGEFSLWSVDRRIDSAPKPVSLGLGTVSFSRMSADLNNRLAVEVTRGHTNFARILPSGEIQAVTTGAGTDWDPAIAPDGAIAYVSNRNGAYEVWVTTPDQQSLRLISLVAGYPTWSPDAKTIAFVAVKGHAAEIYTVARDGSQLRQITVDGVQKKDPVYAPSQDKLYYTERRDGKWRLMQIALTTSAAQPQAVAGGEGWSTLQAAPDGRLYGQRADEDIIRVLDPISSSASHPIDNSPKVSDIDVWAVGAQGIYVRRGRLVHQLSSVWLYPWGQTGRKLADTPLASGAISIDSHGNPIFSQTLGYQVDLGLMELAAGD